MALLPLPALLSRSTCFFCLYLLFQLLFPSSTIPVPASALSHHGQHLFCLMARPGRPTQLPYFQDPYAEELRDCWNAYADADWQSKNCGNKTWYADGLHWHDPKDCHNACKPCINAGIDSWADATVCYREAGTRGSAACQMGYSPRHKQDLVTGSPTDLCDATDGPQRCWFPKSKTAKANILAPDDTTWRNDTWAVRDEFVDVMDELWEVCWNERNTEHGVKGQFGCDHGGCMNDAAGVKAWAHSMIAKVKTYPHWGAECCPDTRNHTGGRLPTAGGPNAPPHYDKEKGRWIGSEDGAIPIPLGMNSKPQKGW